MIWVTWRQHRAQALTMIGIFVFVAVYALALGLWMRSSFNSDDLGPCVARSGGADCAATINSFFTQFNRGPVMPPRYPVLPPPRVPWRRPGRAGARHRA